MSNMVTEDVSPTSGTGAGMIAFLNAKIRQHELVDTTGSALRTGCQKVLDTESDPELFDVQHGDVDDLILRFRNKHRGNMKDATLTAYEKRFRQTVDMYRKWLNNEDWRSAIKPRTTRSTGRTRSDARKADTPTPPVAPARREEAGSEESGEEGQNSGMLTYPFPIRAGLQGKITLPEDLTRREAQRIAAFIATLAFDEEEAVAVDVTAQLKEDE